MPKHLASVSFQSTKGSVIHVEAELHHDIDYSFFDPPENTSNEKRLIKDNDKTKKKLTSEKLSTVNLHGNGIKDKVILEETCLKSPSPSKSYTDIESDDYEDDFEEEDGEQQEKQDGEEEEKEEKEDNNTNKVFDDNDDVETGRMPVVYEASEEPDTDYSDPNEISKHTTVEDVSNNKRSGMSIPQITEEHLNVPKCSASKQNIEFNSEKKKGKDKKVSVVRFNQTVTKKSNENIRKQNNQKKQPIRELMNCIAYDETNNEDESKTSSPSPDFLSLSTDTTSEITDVTTRPSSSGCSSLAKNDSIDDLEAQEHGDRIEVKKSKPSTKFLLETLNSLEGEKRHSMTPSIMSLESRTGTKRRNMSFSNDQLWHIERENAILLRKLEDLRKPGHKSLTRSQMVIHPRLSSSAINRKKQQQKINQENLILLRKIEGAKPTLPSRRTAMKT